MQLSCQSAPTPTACWLLQERHESLPGTAPGIDRAGSCEERGAIAGVDDPSRAYSRISVSRRPEVDRHTGNRTRTVRLRCQEHQRERNCEHDPSLRQRAGSAMSPHQQLGVRAVSLLVACSLPRSKSHLAPRCQGRSYVSKPSQTKCSRQGPCAVARIRCSFDWWRMDAQRGVGMVRGSRSWWIAVAVACGCGALVERANASIALPATIKQEIARSRAVTAPKGGAITNPACFTGRLSTVNPRWAAASLADTHSCVLRYGGASGEAALLRRKSPTARRWMRVGAIGDNCSAHEGGAPRRVLLDLGCGVVYPDAKWTTGVAASANVPRPRSKDPDAGSVPPDTPSIKTHAAVAGESATRSRPILSCPAAPR